MDITNIDADYRNGCSCTNTPCRTKNSVDSISTYPIDSLPKKRSFFGKILNTSTMPTKKRKNKKFDFSIIGGPHYSNDTNLESDWWRQDSTVPTGTIVFSLRPMSLCMGCLHSGILFAGSTWKPSVSPRQIPVELQSVFLFFPKPLLGTRI